VLVWVMPGPLLLVLPKSISPARMREGGGQKQGAHVVIF
jgi:hypothetical protein